MGGLQSEGGLGKQRSFRGGSGPSCGTSGPRERHLRPETPETPESRVRKTGARNIFTPSHSDVICIKTAAKYKH